MKTKQAYHAVMNLYDHLCSIGQNPASRRKRDVIKALQKKYPALYGRLAKVIGATEVPGKSAARGKGGDRLVILAASKLQFEAAPNRTSPIDPRNPAFLQSFEWRRLRMEVLKLYGARCQCCGATPHDGVRICVDHIKPRLHFPELALDINNTQVLCEECNHGKANWDSTDWRAV